MIGSNNKSKCISVKHFCKKQLFGMRTFTNINSNKYKSSSQWRFFGVLGGASMSALVWNPHRLKFIALKKQVYGCITLQVVLKLKTHLCDEILSIGCLNFKPSALCYNHTSIPILPGNFATSPMYLAILLFLQIKNGLFTHLYNSSNSNTRLSFSNF